MKNKVIIGLWVVLGFASAVFLYGCARENTGSQKVVLDYWPSTNPYEIALAEKLVEEWNTLHPDTLVLLQPLPEGRSGEEVLIIAAAGGTAPDVCSNLPPIIVPLLARANALIKIDDFSDGRQFLEDRVPSGLLHNFIALDGNMYQIPWKGNPIMVQYNTGILKEEGIDKIPETWSEFIITARKVTKDRDGNGFYDRWMLDANITAEWRQRLFDFYAFYIAASNGKTLLTDNRYVDFENDDAVKVFDLFALGYEEGWIPYTMFVGDAFLRGAICAHITGPWNIAHTEKRKPEGFEYDFGPIPVPDDYTGGKFTFGDPKSIGIFSTSKHPGAAWEFVKFLISKEADRELLEMCHQLPLRNDLLEDSLYSAYFQNNPKMIKFAELVPFTRGFDQNPALQEVFDAVNQEYDAASIQRMIDSKTAISRAAKRSAKILKARGL